MDVLLSALPLILAVLLMAGPRPQPATVALPICALVAWLVRLAWFGADPLGVHAAVIAGVLAALTPIIIVAGAIALFQVLDRSGALATWRAWLDALSPHPVARVMTVAWAFAYMIEGASGFGTPAALAAPILVACGMPALRAVVLCLVLNSVPVTFGAIGTPIWFGLDNLGQTPEQLVAIGARSALIHAYCAVPLVLAALGLAFRWATIRASLPFIVLSTLACAVPAAIIARYGNEFPSLIGGGIGLIITVLLARRGIGLGSLHADDAAELHAAPPASPVPALSQVLRAFAPLLLCVLLLVLTRIPWLPLKAWLTAAPGTWWQLGSLGEFGLGSGLRVELRGILGTAAQENISLLYLPGIIPFLLIALITPWLVGASPRCLAGAAVATWSRLRGPILALFAGLVLVRLLQQSDGVADACTAILGTALAHGLGSVWYLAAPFLGALGSFFSGSCTMSNLTFGPVQVAAARQLGHDVIGILALQAVGGALGNMVCIHNIVAANSIVGLERSEGAVLRRTILPMTGYALLAGLLAWMLS